VLVLVFVRVVGARTFHEHATMLLRPLRIAAFTVVLPLLFALSQRIAAARGNEPVPGINWALGVVSGLFLVRAAVTERFRGPEANVQKDLFWGVAVGGIVTIISRC
jgi:hypothetical protein